MTRATAQQPAKPAAKWSVRQRDLIPLAESLERFANPPIRWYHDLRARVTDPAKNPLAVLAHEMRGDVIQQQTRLERVELVLSLEGYADVARRLRRDSERLLARLERWQHRAANDIPADDCERMFSDAVCEQLDAIQEAAAKLAGQVRGVIAYLAGKAGGPNKTEQADTPEASQQPEPKSRGGRKAFSDPKACRMMAILNDWKECRKLPKARKPSRERFLAHHGISLAEYQQFDSWFRKRRTRGTELPDRKTVLTWEGQTQFVRLSEVLERTPATTSKAAAHAAK